MTFFCSNSPQSVVEIEDFVKAQPDAIAHSATKIISRLKAGGEKTTQALKSLCWRLKGIQVEVTYLNLVVKLPKKFRNGYRFLVLFMFTTPPQSRREKMLAFLHLTFLFMPFYDTTIFIVFKFVQF